MSLSAPPKLFLGSTKKKTQEDNDRPSIPPAPKAHLTAQGIVYEVDIPVDDSRKNEKQAVEPQKQDDRDPHGEEIGSRETNPPVFRVEESRGVPITAFEYGQAKRCAAQENLLKRRLGEDAVRVDPSLASSQGSSIRSEVPLDEALTTSIVASPLGPGRLRLLSGISASFAPGTLTALMGSSGAG